LLVRCEVPPQAQPLQQMGAGHEGSPLEKELCERYQTTWSHSCNHWVRASASAAKETASGAGVAQATVSEAQATVKLKLTAGQWTLTALATARLRLLAARPSADSVQRRSAPSDQGTGSECGPTPRTALTRRREVARAGSLPEWWKWLLLAPQPEAAPSWSSGPHVNRANLAACACQLD